MEKLINKIPQGTRDLLFEESAQWRQVINGLCDCYKSRGFVEVVTPTIEYFDVFDLGSPSISQEGLYKLFDGNGRILALRPDCTTPIARLFGSRLKDLKSSQRFFYTQQIFCANKELRGKRDELTQSGVELIGAGGISGDMEILDMALDALGTCSENGALLELGNVELFKVLCKNIPFTENDLEDVRTYTETKNFGALNSILDNYEENSYTLALRRLPELFGGEQVLDLAETLVDSKEAVYAVSYVREIYNNLKKMGVADNVVIDFGLVNQIDYYTQLVFKGYIYGCGTPVLSGGRYDDLCAKFGCSTPATGFAINVDIVADAATAEKKAMAVKAPDVFIGYISGRVTNALIRAKEIRRNGRSVLVSQMNSREDTLAYIAQHFISEYQFVD